MRRTTILAAAVAAGVIVGSTASASLVVTETGLTGKALRGPTTPVCRFNKPCYAPFKGTLTFTPVAGSPTAAASVRTQTDTTGHYDVQLHAARYRVTTAAARSRFGGAVKPAVVKVAPGAMTRVNFIVDTGIR